MGGGELILSPSTGSAVSHPVNIRSTSGPIPAASHRCCLPAVCYTPTSKCGPRIWTSHVGPSPLYMWEQTEWASEWQLASAA